MTILDRALRGPVPRATPNHASRAAAGVGRLESAPALFRLLSDSALSRAALSACGLPIALAEAVAPGHPLTFANPAFEEFFGYRAGEAQGESLEALVTIARDGANDWAGDVPARVQLKAHRRDGSPVDVELAIGPLYSTDGRLTHWVLAFNDCTELQALRAELGSLRASER